MNKKYAYTLATIAAIVLIAFLLLRPGQKQSDNYIKLVPANSTIVNRTDFMSLLEKSDIANSELGKSLTSGNAISDVLKRYLEDPKEIGLDLRKPVYIFANANDSTTGLALKILDEDDFTSFLTDLHNENNGIGVPTEKNGLKTAPIEGYGTVAFNAEAAVIIISGKQMTKRNSTTVLATQLFGLKPEEQFVQTDDYKRMAAAKGDTRTYLSMDLLMELPNHIRLFDLPDSTDIKNIRILLNASFNKGEATLAGELYSNDEATAKRLKDKWKNLKHIKGDYLNLMGTNSCLFITACLDGNEIVKEMDREAKTSGDLGNLLSSKHEKELFAKIKNIVSEAEGDAALSIGFASEDESEIPLAIHLAARVKGTGFLADGGYWQQQANRYSFLEFDEFDTDDGLPQNKAMTKIDNNTYALSLMGINTKVGVEGGNTFYLTTEESANAMLKQPASPFITAQKNSITASYGYVLVDLKAAKPFVEQLIGKNTSFNNIAKVVENISINIYDINKGALKISMTDHKQNALKQLVKLYTEVE